MAAPQFKNPVVRWIDYRLPIFTQLNHEYNEYPMPKNCNYLWSFGAIAMVVLIMLVYYRFSGMLAVVGLAADGEHEIGDLQALEGPVVIVVGSEGKGLSRLVGETCDFRVRIPMPGGAESLNAGVAAGVVLYEASRRRG